MNTATKSTMASTAPVARSRNVRFLDSNLLSDDSDREDNTSNQVSKQEDVEKIYEQQAKKKQRDPKPKLLPKQLNEALARIPHEFPRNLGVCSKSVTGAARYANKLMQLYADFVADLPAPADLGKITKMSSQKEVREAIKLQRLIVTRNPHLEKVIGKEKTQVLLQQLDEYEAEQRTQQYDDDNEGATAPPQETVSSTNQGVINAVTEQVSNAVPSLAPVTPTATTTLDVRATNAANEESSDEELEFDTIPSKTREGVLQDSDDDDDGDVLTPRRKRKRHQVGDSDDDEDEVSPETEPNVASSSSRGNNSVTQIGVEMDELSVPQEGQVSQTDVSPADTTYAMETLPDTIVTNKDLQKTGEINAPEDNLPNDTLSDDHSLSSSAQEHDTTQTQLITGSQFDLLRQPSQDDDEDDNSSCDEVATIVPSLTMQDSLSQEE